MAESTMGSWWKRLFGGGGGSSSESQFTTTGDQSTPSLGASFRNLGANLFGTQPTATEKLGMRTVMPGDTTNYSGVKFGQGAILPPGFQAPEGLSNPFGPINLNSPAAVEQPYSAAYTIPFNLKNIQRQAEAVVGLYGPQKPVGATGAGAGAGKGTGGGTAGGTTSPKFTQSEIVQGLIKPTVIPKVDFKSKPNVVVPQGEYDSAIGPNTSAENSAGFFNREMSDMTKTQQQVIDTRAAQKSFETDLDASRLKEKFTADMDNWRAVQAQVDQFNATLNSIETDVRNQYVGSGATESQIQAEITQRNRDLKPTYERLNSQLTTAKALVDEDRLSVQETFGAKRADAKEAVDRVLQKLDFQVQDINSSYALMNGMKDYELKVDAQKDKVRDDNRALVYVAMQNPAMLQRATPQQIADLAVSAGMEPSMLAGVVDMQRNGDFASFPQAGADNLPFLFVNKSTGQVQSGNIPNFYHIVPKASSESLAAQKMIDQADPEFITDISTIYNGLYGDLQSEKTIEGRRLKIQEATAAMGRAAFTPYHGKLNPANATVFTMAVPQLNAMAGTPGPVESTTGSYTPPPPLIEGQ